MTLSFSKMQACGNDFVIIDDRAGQLIGLESALARRLCTRHTGIGADGLILLRPATQASDTSHAQGANRYGMSFVNADGLIGEMCGNGARCLAAFLRRQDNLSHQQLQLTTLAGIVSVGFKAAGITLTLPAACNPRQDIDIVWQEKTWRFDAIDVGVPHAVCFLPTRTALLDAPVAALGRYVRHHPAFSPTGVNVNFIAIENGQLWMRTYERGVEDETLGCGTGATAAALLAHRRYGLPAPLAVWTSSGEALHISFNETSDLLQLTGGAHFVFDGTLTTDFLRDSIPDTTYKVAI